MHSGTLFIALAAALALATAVSATPTQDKYASHGFRYDSADIKPLAPEEFVLMPWGWTPGNAEVLKDIKDCGFNMAGFVAPEFVKMVQKAGLKCFVDDPSVSTAMRSLDMPDAEIEKRVAAMTEKFRDNPTVFGYYLIDEPTAGLFPNLARWASAVRKSDPQATPYINLLPIGAQGPESKDYEDYVEQYAKVVHPTYISYDHYTLHDNGTVGQSLYQNLELMRKVSMRHRIPFWNIVLANSHFRYAEVTQGGLNLQAYATLAYGGRGISYFTYFAPLIGNYRNAAIDQFLHKTPAWDMLRLVNLQIHQLGPTYMKLKSVNVFHNQEVPDGCRGMDSSKYLSEVSGGSFLVGEFEGPDGTPFVLIVNKDIRTPSVGFHVKFKTQGTLMMTSPYTGETNPFGGENGWLSPGSGVLLSMKKGVGFRDRGPFGTENELRIMVTPLPGSILGL